MSKIRSSVFSKYLVLLPLVSFSGITFSSKSLADWSVDLSSSSVTFVSTKQTHFDEIHQIQTFNVDITDDKNVKVTLDLSSIESGIPIRNERMREMLFDVSNTRYAELSFSLPQEIAEFKGTSRHSTSAELQIKGTTAPLQLDLLITATEGQVTGTLLKPAIVTAQQFGLEKGVDALKEIAGLTSIGYAVPVFATIVLKD